MSTSDDFQAVSMRLHDAAMDVFMEKNQDYAKVDDVLAAFRRQAESTGLSMRQVWSVHFTKQVEAVLTWSKNGELAGESLDSRLADVRNYLSFAKLIDQEENA